MKLKIVLAAFTTTVLITEFSLAAKNVPAQNSPILRQTPTVAKKPEKDYDLKIESAPKKKIFKQYDIKPILEKKEENTSGGGWGSSGGGSGIACFKNEDDANRAEDLIEKNQLLPQSLIDQIEELSTLEYWEWKKHQRYKLSIPDVKSAQDFVSEIHKRAATLLPLFAFRLEQAESLIEFSHWKEKDQVSRIPDAKPRFDLPNNCKQVQLAARYTKDAYARGEGPSKKVPLAKVDVNKALYDKLDLLNQAILIVHEQMYLIAQLLGHQTSDELRPIVLQFFSEAFATEHPTSPYRFALKARLVAFFGDYINYFGDDLTMDPNEQVKEFSQESRLISFYTMVNKVRDRIDKCQKGQLPKEEMVPWIANRAHHTCKDFGINPNLLQLWISDEMAFIYVAYFQFEVTYQVTNTEYLLAPFEDPEFLKTSIGVTNWICDIVKRNEGKLDFPVMEQKALRYCQAFKNSLSPKGKDQN